jgi:poly-gamma-glutamate synthesis protein (capsule biosynthesis protein)
MPIHALRRRTLLIGAGALAASSAPRAASAPRATLTFLGDVMLGRDISELAREQPPEWFWGEVLPILQATDGVIANLESPITEETRRTDRSLKLYHFRADPRTVEILRAGKVRAVCLANNHMLDHGERGLAETRRLLDAAGIVHVGAGDNLAEAAAPALLDVAGLRVGLLGASDHLSEFAAGPARPGTHVVSIGQEEATLDWIERGVAALRASRADLVVLSLHWGPNWRHAPTRRFRDFARAAVERGVDVLHGHSAHIVHGVEAIGRSVVLYDTGDALDDYSRVPLVPQHQGFVFLLDLEQGRPRRLRLVPTENNPLPPRLAAGRVRAGMLLRMRAACTSLGTATRETAEGLEIVVG